MITQAELKEILDYDPETGDFTYLVDRGRLRKGDRAGAMHAMCIQIKINYQLYKAHRLAWLYVYGELPPSELDHIDRNRLNNAIANLRLANRSTNMANTGLRYNNKSGFKGVHWSYNANKWHARITVDGKIRHLGYFVNIEDAALAYKTAAVEAWGEFVC